MLKSKARKGVSELSDLIIHQMWVFYKGSKTSPEHLNFIYYIDADEVPEFFLLIKNHIFIARSEDTIFIFHVWGYWCRHGY